MSVVELTPQGLKALGEKLKNYREVKGWSQREAARYITASIKPGLTASALGRIEQGSAKVSMETLLMLGQLGYGGMGFSEMVDVATERRLNLCENGGSYRAEPKKLITA